jgi:hypothetical protein
MAQVAIEKAEQERKALSRAIPDREEKQQTARIIRMLPRAAEVLRERVPCSSFAIPMAARGRPVA